MHLSITVRVSMILLIVITQYSCRTLKPHILYGSFKFRQRADEMIFKPDFISFIESKPNCSFVLRVPLIGENVTEEGRFREKSQYFTIEKILMKNGYTVNDRNLFEKRINHNIETAEQTDFILELVEFNNVNYYTNKVIPESSKDNSEATLPRFFTFTGGLANFKIIRIETNEVVAISTLNYTPCTEGCRIRYTNRGIIEEVEGDVKIRKKTGYQSIDKDKNAIMLEELSIRLFDQIKKEVEKLRLSSRGK